DLDLEAAVLVPVLLGLGFRFLAGVVVGACCGVDARRGTAGNKGKKDGAGYQRRRGGSSLGRPVRRCGLSAIALAEVESRRSLFVCDASVSGRPGDTLSKKLRCPAHPDRRCGTRPLRGLRQSSLVSGPGTRVKTLQIFRKGIPQLCLQVAAAH